MSELERQELTSRIMAMSREEIKLVASLIPSEILANEIGMRLLVDEQKITRAAMVLK